MEASALTGNAPARRGPRVPRAILRVASDDRLVALVRAGSEPAFEQLYERHHRGVLSFCRHMLGDREEAEDAVQHTFLAAYRDLVGSDKPIQLKAWLYAIARNRSLSVLRARREHADVDRVQPATEGLVAEVESREDLRGLLGDLAGLPVDQRAALVLAELGDIPHADIAAVLDVPKDKVKALVFQARSSLIDARKARDTSCAEIREELSTLTGGALRRAHLRRHLEICDDCRAFRDAVRSQRAAMAIVLPVLPSAGLKAGALPAWGASHAAAVGSAAGATATSGAASSGLATAAAAGGAAVAKGVAAKVLVAAAIAGTAAGGVATVQKVGFDTGPLSSGSPSQSENAKQPGKNGVVPVNAAGPGGNSERAHDLARSRGKGQKNGLIGDPGKSGARGKAGSAPGGTRSENAKARGRSGAARTKTKPARTRKRPTHVKKVHAAPPAKVAPTPAPKAKEPAVPKDSGDTVQDVAPVLPAVDAPAGNGGRSAPAETP
jgi:RNA polymerase sigma factor (sigma-70 family)